MKLFIALGIFFATILADSTLQAKDSYVSLNSTRNYWSYPTQKELKDIRYITNLTGMGSLAKIAISRSSLKKTGARVDHVHPLNFLYAIFSDEESKVSIYALQKRDWVWGEFFGGIQTSFKEESEKHNITSSMVSDFAERLSVDDTLLQPLVEQCQWKELVNVLINVIPRKTQANRYNW